MCHAMLRRYVLGVDSLTGGDTLNINDVFEALFLSCEVHTREALASGLLPKDDVDSLEAYIYIGVPAVVIFNALLVSVLRNVVAACLADVSRVLIAIQLIAWLGITSTLSTTL